MKCVNIENWKKDFFKDIAKSLDQGNHEAGLEYLHRKWDQSHKKMKEFGASVPLEAPGPGNQNMKDDRQKHPDASQSREKDLIKLPLQSKGKTIKIFWLSYNKTDPFPTDEASFYLATRGLKTLLIVFLQVKTGKSRRTKKIMAGRSGRLILH